VRVLANAGENIHHLASIRLCILHAIRSEKRQSICARKINQLAIDAVLAPNEMSLDFNENIVAPESIDQQFDAVRARLGSARVSRAGDGVLAIANFSERAKSMISGKFVERLFRRDAESPSRTGICTRDACATQSKEGDQPFGGRRQLMPSHCAFSFFAAQMRLSQEFA